MLELIIFIIFIISFVGLVVLNILTNNKKRYYEKMIAQAAIEKFAIMTQLKKIQTENENKKLEESDSFVKFLSDSREWAFQYIEDVQSSIKDYANNKDEDSYNKLISFLPKEEEKR